MDVRKVMTADPACCTPTTPLRDVARMMAENDCGEIPVVDDAVQKHPIGVVTDRDIVLRSLAVGRDPTALSAGDCMTTPAVTTRPDCSLEDCRELMEAHQIRRVPVVDEAGRLCGIIAQADIAQASTKRETGELVKEVSAPGPTAH